MNEEKFLELLNEKKFKDVRSALQAMNTVDIADVLSDLDDKELIQAFRLIEKSKAVEDAPHFIDTVEKEIFEITKNRRSSDFINISEIANAILKLANNPTLARQMGEHGYLRFMYRYKSEYMVETYKKIYRIMANMSEVEYTEESFIPNQK